MYSHCDCVVNIASKRAEVIGGNNSNKVGANYAVNLDDNNYVTDSKKTVILRYQPVAESSVSSTNLTAPTTEELAQNQIKVKNKLKAAGLTKAQAAGVMGNILHECGFNPLAVNKADTNGYPSVGLIQWNGRYTPSGGGSKNVEDVFNVIGRTVEDQMDYLINNYSSFKTYLNLTKSETDAYQTGFVFAEKVEVCYNCNKGFSVYNDKSSANQYSPYKRSEGAVEFLNRFNNSSDSLYWDGSGQITSSSATNSGTNSTAGATSIVIGDSLYASIQHANPKIRQVTDVAPQVGKHLSVDGGNGPNAGGKSLINQLTAAKVYNDVKHVVVTIGANDLWAANTAKQNEAIYLIKQKFPKAKYYIMNGNYGWGGLEVKGVKTDIYWQNLINSYINVFKNADFTVVGSVTKVLSHPGVNDAFYNTYKDKLKELP